MRCNSSIHQLILYCNGSNILDGVGQAVLNVYQEKNTLTELRIVRDHRMLETLDLSRNAGGLALVAMLEDPNCNLRSLFLGGNQIDSEGAIAIANCRMLETLDLSRNRIGNAGGLAFAALLENPNCNLCSLFLDGNQIDSEGAIAIANGLAKNTLLGELSLKYNTFDYILQPDNMRAFQAVEDAFTKLLYNQTSINSIYLSNHTLERLSINFDGEAGSQLSSLLHMNNGKNKSHVAIRKILWFHPNIDMEPLFEFGATEDGDDRTLKALPYVIDWYLKANEADTELSIVKRIGGNFNADKEKLWAIYQFAKAMPLLFEGIVNI